MFHRLNQKNALLVIVFLCSSFLSMMVMLITYPKTVWVDTPKAGRVAFLRIHNTFDRFQNFAHNRAALMAAKIHESRDFIGAQQEVQ